MEKVYERFLVFTGKCLKSKKLIPHVYGIVIVEILALIFHLKHYNKDDIWNEIKLQLPDRANDKILFKKIKRAYIKYLCSAREYIVYDFEHKSPKEIKTYLLDIKKIVLVTLINKREVLKILNAKQKAYEVFKPFYKRDVFYVDSRGEIDRQKLEKFVALHKEFMLKPANLSLGRGIKKCHISDYSSIDELENELSRNRPVILEELLHNDANLAIFHPESLNIVRIISFRNKEGEVKLYKAYLSLGQGNKDYANAASGAIAVPIDLETGVTYGSGVTEGKMKYAVHPDSNIELNGYPISKWNELKEMVYELADIMPEMKYVGWDLALTNDRGWVVVEGNGNAGQMLYQVMKGESIYNEFMHFYMQT